MAGSTTEGKPRTKTQVYSAIAEETGLNKKDVVAVFEAMAGHIKADLRKGGPGTYNVGGLMKIKTKSVEAKPKRWGTNPFTKEEQWFAAKPASTRVKITPMKALKDMV